MGSGILRRHAAVVLVLVASVGVAASLVACGKPVRPGPVVWYDLEHGEALARKEGKPAVIFVWAAWSKADEELDRESFGAPEVREALGDFVAIKIDVTDDRNTAARTISDRRR